MLGRTVCNCMVTFLSEITRTFVFRRSLHDPMKTVVVIFGIKTGIWFRRRIAAADDSTGPAVARPWRRHGVFVVVPTRFALQALLAVGEHHAVARIRERAAGMDQLVGLPGLRGQAGQRDVGTPAGR